MLNVAPYTGAWIETLKRVLFGVAPDVAPYTGAWIETNSTGHRYKPIRRTLYGCVD